LITENISINISMALLFVRIISLKNLHFGRNPIVGGMPAIISRIIIVIVRWLLSFIVLFLLFFIFVFMFSLIINTDLK